MGLGDTTGAKNMLKMRAPSGWLTKDMLGRESTRDDVTFVISDFLLDVHRIASNPQLTYERLVNGIQGNVLNFVRAFPNIHTIIILLDESRYVPLGKVPTQDRRKKPLTPSERSKILDGGVISKMDPNLQESIDAIYSKESSVRDGKNTAFSVFFERYVRTRELRKDLVVFITKCLMNLVSTGKISSTVRLYIDGMSVSTYYSSPDHIFSAKEDEDGTPLVKRRRSLSAVETINRHKHEDDGHLSVCKLTWTSSDYGLSLTKDHPSHSNNNGSNRTFAEGDDSEKQVKPLWLPVEAGDSEIFMQYKGPHERKNMGESDIKISYYVRRIAETLAYMNKRESPEDAAGCTCLVSSSDTDIIVILLLCMKEIPSSVSHCFDVFLDTQVGGSSKQVILIHDPNVEKELISREGSSGVFSHALGRIVWKDEGEYLTNVANIQALYRGINHYFRELHPAVENAVETLCLFLLLSGSDYVDSLPGIGFEKLRTTFDLGGYLFLSEAISIRSISQSDQVEEISSRGGRTVSSIKKLSLDLNEARIKSFLNLVYRYALGIGPLKEISKELRREKSRLTSDAKKKAKEIKELREDEEGNRKEMEQDDYDKIHEIELDMEDVKRQRDFLNNFLFQKTYTALTNAFNPSRGGSKEKLKRLIHSTMGITSTGKEHEDWCTIEDAMKAKRTERIGSKRKALIKKINRDKKLDDEKKRGKIEEVRSISDKDILATFKRDISDLKNGEQIDSVIRRVGWNIAYWLFSPFVCPRETKHLNSMCHLNLERENVSEVLSRAQRQKGASQDSSLGENHTMEEYYSPKPYAGRPASDEKTIDLEESTGETRPLVKRKRRMSLNGFLRIYEDSASSGGGGDGGENKRPRKTKIIRSKSIFPASRVVIDLVHQPS
jgi:hypothetical protein